MSGCFLLTRIFEMKLFLCPLCLSSAWTEHQWFWWLSVQSGTVLLDLSLGDSASRAGWAPIYHTEHSATVLGQYCLPVASFWAHSNVICGDCEAEAQIICYCIALRCGAKIWTRWISMPYFKFNTSSIWRKGLCIWIAKLVMPNVLLWCVATIFSAGKFYTHPGINCISTEDISTQT